MTERFPSRPYITEGYPHNKTVLLNATVQFECKTVSDLEPYIQWFKTNYTLTVDVDNDEWHFPNGNIVQVT